MTNIAIIEDDRDIREGIQRYLNLQTDMCCEHAFESMEAFFEGKSKSTLPDVILMDIGLPGMSGLDGMRLIRAEQPDASIIMLTVYDDPNRIFNALCSGAVGYLLKNVEFTKIKEAILTVKSGGAFMSPQIARKVIHFFGEENKSAPTSPLSPKEHEVVIGLVDGLSYKMIADRLQVKLDTIRSHIRNIYKKLQVNSKAEVIAKSLKGEI